MIEADIALREAEAGGHPIRVCDRCVGRFPGIGVRINGYAYCCDKCAAGPGAQHRVRMLAAAAVLLGVGLGSVGRLRKCAAEMVRNLESGE